MGMTLALVIAAILGGCEAGSNIYGHYVDGSSIVLIEGPVSDLQVQDVLDSVLFAQIMATHYYSKFEKISDWYRTNLEYLQKVGWLIDASSFDILYCNSSLTLQGCLLKTLEDKLEQAQLDSLLTSLTDLYKDNSSVALQIFRNESTKGSLHILQILLVQNNDDGSLATTYFGLVFDIFDNNYTQIFVSSGLGFLNNDDYSLYRNDTTQYIKDYFKTYVIKY